MIGGQPSIMELLKDGKKRKEMSASKRNNLPMNKKPKTKKLKNKKRKKLQKWKCKEKEK